MQITLNLSAEPLLTGFCQNYEAGVGIPGTGLSAHGYALPTYVHMPFHEGGKRP